MRYPPEHRDHTRARIVSAASRLFRRRGFTGVSVEKVMRAAGLTVGGFYLHFGSKQRPCFRRDGGAGLPASSRKPVKRSGGPLFDGMSSRTQAD
jgi:AcrR family transcriptional regulator